MKLEDCRKMAQVDADNYGVEINIVYDQLLEEEEKYTFCAQEMMYIFHPEHHKDYWKVIEVIKPKKRKRFVRSL
jgi:hypothetical protein